MLTRPSVLDLEGELRRPQLEPENSRPGANGRAKAHALPRDPVGVTAKRAGTKELGALVQAFQDFLQGRQDSGIIVPFGILFKELGYS